MQELAQLAGLKNLFVYLPQSLDYLHISYAHQGNLLSILPCRYQGTECTKTYAKADFCVVGLSKLRFGSFLGVAGENWKSIIIWTCASVFSLVPYLRKIFFLLLHNMMHNTVLSWNLVSRFRLKKESVSRWFSCIFGCFPSTAKGWKLRSELDCWTTCRGARGMQANGVCCIFS